MSLKIPASRKGLVWIMSYTTQFKSHYVICDISQKAYYVVYDIFQEMDYVVCDIIKSSLCRM